MPNTIGLEGLDQFGTLDSLPYSLDNNWTDEGICGPWTLEQIDQFNTNLDAIELSFDSASWDTACIKLQVGISFTGTGNLSVVLPDFVFAEAAITGTGTLTASADLVAPELASASFAGSGNLSASGTVIVPVSGAITGEGSLSASADFVLPEQVQALFTGTGTLNATANIVEPVSVQASFSGIGSLDGSISVTYNTNEAAFSGTGSFVVGFSNVFDVSAFIRGSTNVSAKLYIYGEEWSLVADEANTWTIVSPETNTWTEVQPGNNVWRLRA